MAGVILQGFKEFTEYDENFSCQISIVFTRDRPEILEAFSHMLKKKRKESLGIMKRMTGAFKSLGGTIQSIQFSKLMSY